MHWIKTINTKNQRGYALPTVLVLSMVLLTIGISAFQAGTSISKNLADQNWNRIAKQAAQSGVSYATSCLKQSEVLWTSSLAPNTDCQGTASNPAASPYIKKDGSTGSVSTTWRSSFSVATPAGGPANPRARTIGKVELVSTNGTVLKTYTSEYNAIIGIVPDARDKTADVVNDYRTALLAYANESGGQYPAFNTGVCLSGNVSSNNCTQIYGPSSAADMTSINNALKPYFKDGKAPIPSADTFHRGTRPFYGVQLAKVDAATLDGNSRQYWIVYVTRGSTCPVGQAAYTTNSPWYAFTSNSPTKVTFGGVFADSDNKSSAECWIPLPQPPAAGTYKVQTRCVEYQAPGDNAPGHGSEVILAPFNKTWTQDFKNFGFSVPSGATFQGLKATFTSMTVAEDGGSGPSDSRVKAANPEMKIIVDNIVYPETIFDGSFVNYQKVTTGGNSPPPVNNWWGHITNAQQLNSSNFGWRFKFSAQSSTNAFVVATVCGDAYYS